MTDKMGGRSMAGMSSIDEKLMSLTKAQIDSLHGIYRVSEDEDTRRNTIVKREDAPMWVVLEEESVASKIQRCLFKLKATLNDVRWDSSFRSVMNNNMGGGIPYQICKEIIDVMADEDMVNPLTEQDIFEHEEKRRNGSGFTFFYLADKENGYLSNWYISHFEVEGKVYSSAEQYLMEFKARLFQDSEIAAEIMKTDDLTIIKGLGKQVRNYKDPTWNVCRKLVMEQGLRAKFSQNTELRQTLLATGDTILAECSKRDKIWGIGLDIDDPKRFDMAYWDGESLLGRSLMKIRKELRCSD
jgi:hypothetical protein